jgi:hypothetical protein
MKAYGFNPVGYFFIVRASQGAMNMGAFDFEIIEAALQSTRRGKAGKRVKTAFFSN